MAIAAFSFDEMIGARWYPVPPGRYLQGSLTADGVPCVSVNGQPSTDGYVIASHRVSRHQSLAFLIRNFCGFPSQAMEPGSSRGLDQTSTKKGKPAMLRVAGFLCGCSSYQLLHFVTRRVP